MTYRFVRLSFVILLGLTALQVNSSESASANQLKALAHFENVSDRHRKQIEKREKEAQTLWQKQNTDRLRYSVSYANNLSSRITEDFHSDTIRIETLVNQPNADEQHKRAVEQQLEKVTTANSKVNDIEKAPKVISKTTGQSMETLIEVGSHYTDQRALSYIDQIKASSKTWKVPPSLVMAIIYQESRFNPKAQSKAPAYGLMQIMEKSAAADVSNSYLKKQKITVSTLFNPGYNIEIGAAYLSILTDKYLKNVESEHSRLLLSIAAYNAGVGSVAKHFTGTTSLTQLSEAANKMEFVDIYKSLTTAFPFKETREYVKVVVDKEHYYQQLLKRY
ncbi:transglycosylase SLT domain-containing protein [Vibrio breoganii]|uniref:transglycosylase SLT domain-containing protein n=1 Tax=Vibrio breoganii TaxID=553239 RepID=UPI0021C35E72|nr:transglycosylase SLT domain-containing protein [Vibrio breoganii]MDN3717758.1 transglycosylase SLT domain-containing protein [Vibrio breoganii]